MSKLSKRLALACLCMAITVGVLLIGCGDRATPPPIPRKVLRITAIPRHILEPVFRRDGTLDRTEWNRRPIASA